MCTGSERPELIWAEGGSLVVILTIVVNTSIHDF